jgi:hypothetical protein
MNREPDELPREGGRIVMTKKANSVEADEDAHGMAALDRAKKRKKRARGGKVEGEKARKRLDRPARHGDEAADKALIKRTVKAGALKPHFAKGGKVKKGTTVNVIVAGGGAQGAGAPPPPPPMAPPPPPGPQMAPPPRPMMGGTPGGMPMGAPGAPAMRAKGGRVGYPIEDGAGSGPGRLEKIGKRP